MLKEPTRRDYFNLTVFYVAPTFFWAIVLLVVLQKRIESFVPASDLTRALSILVNAGGIVSVVVQIIIGAVSDRHRGKHGRRRPFIVIGTFLSLPAIWLFALAGNFVMLVVSFMLLQLFLNVAHAPYQALVPDTIPPERHGIASGYMGLWQLVGQAGGLAVGALLFSGVFGKNGMMYLFGFFTLLFVSLMTLTVTRVSEEPYEGERVPKRQAMLNIFKTDLKGNPSFVWVLISRFLINLGFYTALLYLAWYLEFALGIDKDLSKQYTFVLALVVTGTGLIATLPAGRMSDTFSKKAVIYGCCSLCIVSAVLFCLAGGMTWAVIAAAVFGLGFGAFAAVDWALACNVLPEGDAGKFLGIWSVSFVFPQMAAAVIGDLVISLFGKKLGLGGAYRAVFASIIPLMVLGTLAVSQIREKPVRQASD